MFEILFWLYLPNAVLFINHEIDSAYWKEWLLFKLPGGITGFLVIRFPLLFLALYGLILVYKQSDVGLIFSLLLSFGGLFAFAIHMFFIKKGIWLEIKLNLSHYWGIMPRTPIPEGAAALKSLYISDCPQFFFKTHFYSYFRDSAGLVNAAFIV